MMEERIPKSCSSSETEQKISKQGDIVPAIQIKENSNLSGIGLIEDETVIKEIEVGEGISAFHDGTIQELNEVIPEIILNEDDHSLTGENDISGKWSHNDIVIFLGVLNDVLDTQEEAGGFLSRKNLFSRVTTILNDQGKTVTRAEVEKKYNNMLITYRRCQQRLLKKGQTPYWPYFKVMAEIKRKQEGQSKLSLGTEATENLDRLGGIKRTNPFDSDDSFLVRYPFVSAVPDSAVGAVPKVLTREWQQKRSFQEQRKASLVEGLFSEWRYRREEWREKRKKLMDSTVKENSELNAISQELTKGRLHISKELRYLAQDVACLASAVKSVRSMK